MSSVKRLAGFSGALLVATSAACKPNGEKEEAFRPIAVGQEVPQLTVRTLEGDTARVAPGEPVTLLHVWATWCGPCEKEFPEIEALQKEFGPRGLRILAISVDEGDRKNSSVPSRRHRGAMPPSMEIFVRNDEGGTAWTYTSSRPDSSDTKA